MVLDRRVAMDLEGVRFGSFEFNLSTGELRRDGMLLRLQAQPAKVLSHLIRHAGEVVSREDLHNAIWGDETFVDFERGLNVCIAQIRSALNDESASPHFIRTVPRRGYQFIYSVEPIAAASDITPRADQRNVPWRTILLSLAGIVVAVAVVVVVNQLRQMGPAASTLPIVAIVPFENQTGDSGLNSFCSALTENVVEQLTSAGGNHYQVIGNAEILRTSAEPHDLVQIAASLHAQYVVLGQVQGGGTKMRILAHLIHMPEQTHVWVVRLEQPFDDPFALESSAAHDIAAEFSRKLEDAAVLSNLHGRASR
jgi:DNA-binding winged helix-turn-helix (wHTH) protein/TolB-like protein